MIGTVRVRLHSRKRAVRRAQFDLHKVCIIYGFSYFRSKRDYYISVSFIVPYGRKRIRISGTQRVIQSLVLRLNLTYASLSRLAAHRKHRYLTAVHRHGSISLTAVATALK